MALRLFAVVAVAALAGCGSSTTKVLHADEVDIEGLRAETTSPRYWLGEEFGGLPITHADRSGLVVYGTCEVEGGWFEEGGCAPPVQIQHLRFDRRQWAAAVGCNRLPTLRGVPSVRHDGLVLVTDRQLVKIYARNQAEDIRVAEVLRPLNGPRRQQLPPPDEDVAKAIKAACG